MIQILKVTGDTDTREKKGNQLKDQAVVLQDQKDPRHALALEENLCLNLELLHLQKARLPQMKALQKECQGRDQKLMMTNWRTDRKLLWRGKIKLLRRISRK